MSLNNAHLLRNVRELELVAERNVSSLLSGNYLTTFRGGGLDFHEARKYTPGEPIRRIDWRMTARMREAYVRVHLEERQREVFLAVDTSASMFTGWAERTKIETAVEVAATLGAAATRAGDRLGFITFSDRVHTAAPPRLGRKSLFALLRELAPLVGPGSSSRTAMREANPNPSDTRVVIHRMQQHRGRRFVVFLLSDFIEGDLPEDLRYLEKQHDVTLVQILDPLENTQPPPYLRRPIRAAEGPPRPGHWCGEDARALEATGERLAMASRRRGLSLFHVSTTDPVGPCLQHALHAKSRYLQRSRAALRS